MHIRTFKRIVALLLVLSLGIACCEAQTKARGRNPEKALFGRSVKTKQTKVKEPRKVVKAKRIQEKKEKKLKKDYDNFVEESKKRSFRIQTPKVQARMVQDQKNIAARDKAKKKRTKAATRRAARKYK
jgi:hypothetical protein